MKKHQMKKHHSHGWYRDAEWTMHPVDALDSERLRGIVKERGLFIPLRDKSPEIMAIRKRLSKLRKIARLEAEACGEESW